MGDYRPGLGFSTVRNFSQNVILGRAAKRRRPEYPAVGRVRACGWTPAPKARAPGLHTVPGSPKGRGDGFWYYTVCGSSPNVILARASQGHGPEEASCEDPLIGLHQAFPWTLGSSPRVTGCVMAGPTKTPKAQAWSARLRRAAGSAWG